MFAEIGKGILTMKKFFIVILSALLCLSLVSCSKKYVSDVETTVISETLQLGIATDGGYTPPSDKFMTLNIGIPDYYIEEFEIITANDTANQNQIGIFKATSTKNAKKVANYCESYLNNRIANFDHDIDPDESDKINNAQVNVFGLYVIYTILSPEDTEYALIIIENLILDKP